MIKRFQHFHHPNNAVWHISIDESLTATLFPSASYKPSHGSRLTPDREVAVHIKGIQDALDKQVLIPSWMSRIEKAPQDPYSEI